MNRIREYASQLYIRIARIIMGVSASAFIRLIHCMCTHDFLILENTILLSAMNYFKNVKIEIKTKIKITYYMKNNSIPSRIRVNST